MFSKIHLKFDFGFSLPSYVKLRICFLYTFYFQFLGTLVGLLYLRLPYDQTAIQNFNSLIFLIIINTSFTNIFAVVQVNIFEINDKKKKYVLFQSYTREYPIFYKEYDDAVYRVPPYYFAKFVTEVKDLD